mmetsp:Transcript_24272/g.43191  ORF Transcript_24272/g.43191 Transcript_24272/m.43191 type:complete len:359 (-) Transcript_24272:403-1479(-)
MYDDLYTNLPSESMSYFGLTKVYSKTYCHRNEVQDYLKQYAQHFDLYRLITFNTAVTLVLPLSQEEFEVTTRNKQGNESTQIFNRIAVCIGNYSVPYIPTFEGEKTFSGRITPFKHFKNFLSEDFEGKTVIVVGGGYSALDALIFLLFDFPRTTVILSAEATEVSNLFASSDFDPFIASGRLTSKPRIQRIEGSFVEFADKSSLAADEIILCTGYIHKMPFLPHQVMSEEGRYLENLYKSIIDILHPRIAHIGLIRGLTMLRLELSAMFVLQEWLKEPDTEHIRRVLTEDERSYTDRGQPKRKFYALATRHTRDCFAVFGALGIHVDAEMQDYYNEMWTRHAALVKQHRLTLKSLKLS